MIYGKLNLICLCWFMRMKKINETNIKLRKVSLFPSSIFIYSTLVNETLWRLNDNIVVVLNEGWMAMKIIKICS